MDTAQTRWTARHKQHIGRKPASSQAVRSAGAFSVCAPCLPHREADIHKKVIAAALRLSALLYIINAEHIPVSPLPITERFR